MARITEASLDDSQLRLLRASGKRRLAPLEVSLAPATPVASLVLLVVGAGALVGGLTFPDNLVAIGAVAIGGYLAGGRTGTPAELAVLHRERGEVIRAALGLGLRGGDALVELARGRGESTPGAQPGPPGDADPAARRPTALRPVARPVDDDDGSESLSPAADDYNR